MKQIIIIILALFVTTCYVSGQNIIKGFILDGGTNEALPGANIIEVSNSQNGVISDFDGRFALRVESLPTQVKITYLGYEEQIIDVNSDEGVVVNMQVSANSFDEIVVTASREPQKITDAPVTITKIGAKAIAQTASSEPFEMLATAKGVEYNRKGVGVVDFNIRGFNTSFNARNMVLVDGRNSGLIAFGIPYLQLVSFNKEDIQNMEVVLGPASALYGFGASNGMINITTKSTRKKGNSLAISGGTQDQFGARFRHTNAINDKWSYKVSGAYNKATDFDYSDEAYYSISRPNLPQFLENGTREVGLNLVNEFAKMDGAVTYRAGTSTNMILSGGYSVGDFVQTTGVGRIQFDNLSNSYVQLKMVSPHWYINGYYNKNKTGNDNSYVLSIKTDNYLSYNQWSAVLDAQQAPNYVTTNYPTEQAILDRAHSFRLISPALAPFGLAELEVDSRFKDNSSRLNGEVQYNNRWDNLRLVTGVQLNQDLGETHGTYLNQEDGHPIKYTTFGGYAQLEYKISDSYKLIGAARGDNHSKWGFEFSPKLALVKSVNDGNGAFRVTYGRGVVVPTLLQGELEFASGRFLGNGDGFTFLDVNYNTFETTVSKLDPLATEKLDAFEVGYKGKLSNKIYLDVNAFYNTHTDFITNSIIEIGSPTTGRFITHKGDEPISDFQTPLFAVSTQAALGNANLQALIDNGIVPGNASVSGMTYFNFGKLHTFGTDIGLRYVFNDKWSSSFNYSYFGNSYDENDPANDLNGDGKVQEGADVAINSPEHKINFGLKFDNNTFFGSLNARWASEFNYFSGTTNASATLDPSILVGEWAEPVIAGKVVNGSLNEGPLGGFVNVDLNIGWNINKNLTWVGGVSNVFDAKVRDFVSSATMGRLLVTELKYTF